MKTFFISSTFRDMHYERDILHERVFPEINARAMKYGDEVAMCDLRWGVNTEDMDSESSARKVLSVCMDEIDQCRPYMIVLLGQRYGWIPGKDAVLETAVRGELDLDDLEKSVTALEIEYGALKTPEKIEKVLFYFREIVGSAPPGCQSEDYVREQKLIRLKERIRKLSRGHVRTYRVWWDDVNQQMFGLEKFAEMVTSDISEMLKEEWEACAKMTEDEKKRRIHWNLAKEKSSRFTVRTGEAGELISRLNDGERLLLVQGETGSGKSTLAGYLAVRLREQGCQVLPVFCGREGDIRNAQEAAVYILRFLEDLLGMEHFQPGRADKSSQLMLFIMNQKVQGMDSREWGKRLKETALSYCDRSDKKLIFIVDGVDSLDADEMRRELSFLPHCLSEKIQTIMTCSDAFDIDMMSVQKEVRDNLLRPIVWNKFSETERRKALEIALKVQRRELSDVVKEEVINKEGSGNPFYLSLLVQRLVMMNKNDFDAIAADGDGIDAISNHVEDIVNQASGTVAGLLQEILTEASRRMGTGREKEAVLYIALSDHGFRECDISELMNRKGAEWNSLSFSLLIKYLYTLFTRDADGRYTIINEELRQEILKGCQDRKAWYKDILEYLKSLPDKDTVKMEETAWQCFCADDREYIVRYITDSMSVPVVNDTLREELSRISKIDNGKWISEVIRGAAVYGAGAEFINFFTFFCQIEVMREFMFSDRAELTEQIAESMEKLVHDINSERQRTDVTIEWGRFLETLSSIYLQRSDEIRALLYNKMRLDAYREVLRGNIGEDYKIEVAAALIDIAIMQGNLDEGLRETSNLLEEGAEILAKLSDNKKETSDYKAVFSRFSMYKAIIFAMKLYSSQFVNRDVVCKASEELCSAAEVAFNDVTDMGCMLSPMMYLIAGDILVSCIGIEESARAMELYIKAANCNEAIKEKYYFSKTMYWESNGRIYEGISSLYEKMGDAGSMRTALTYCREARRIFDELRKWDSGKEAFWTERSAEIILRTAKIYGRLGKREDMVESGKYYRLYTQMRRTKVELTSCETDYIELIRALADEVRHPTTGPAEQRQCIDEILELNDKGVLPDKKICRDFVHWARDNIYLVENEKYELACEKLDAVKVPIVNSYKVVKDSEIFLRPMIDAAERRWLSFNNTPDHRRKCGPSASLLIGEQIPRVLREFSQELLSHRTLLSDGHWQEDVTFYADYAFYLMGIWRSFANLEELEKEPDYEPTEDICGIKWGLIGYILDWDREDVWDAFSDYENIIYDHCMLPSIAAWPDKISPKSVLPREEKESYTINAIRLFIMMILTAEMYIRASKGRLRMGSGVTYGSHYLQQKVETWSRQTVKKILCHYKYLKDHRLYLPRAVVEELENLISYCE